ncbi:response regulator [Alsobacter metallidurans]|uniref:Response regulator n=1 Tax=Alsobacter metallidurans TaxID=340221 RepID=A0A917IAX3_9HYPH|nr:response regulator [Alsobacter metallidurans]GGH29138.1 response regulator [Alsobacter metallidurans]
MKTCLVADDSPVIRKVARRILEGLDFRVEEAEDGQQALAACQRSMPDAVLIDGFMPVMDGFDFCKALRRTPGGGVPKVLVWNTENEVAVMARAIHAGADDVLLKPFDRAQMTNKLTEVGLIQAR